MKREVPPDLLEEVSQGHTHGFAKPCYPTSPIFDVDRENLDMAFSADACYNPSTMHCRFLPLAISCALLLAACVDTTGISPESSKKPKGSASAAVTVTEFGDLQCPACKAAHSSIVKPLSEAFESQISIEFRQFPLRSIHPYAFEAAQASECAADQGKFWEFLDINYEHQDDLSKRPFEEWAASLKLDADLFHRCLASGIKGKAVLEEYAEGEKLGVAGTPSFFVNGIRVQSNTLEAIVAAISAAKEKVRSVPL